MNSFLIHYRLVVAPVGGEVVDPVEAHVGDPVAAPDTYPVIPEGTAPVAEPDAALAETQIELPPAGEPSESSRGSMPHPVNAFFSQFNIPPSGDMPPPVPTDDEDMQPAPGTANASVGPKRRAAPKSVLLAAKKRSRTG